MLCPNMNSVLKKKCIIKEFKCHNFSKHSFVVMTLNVYATPSLQLFVFALSTVNQPLDRKITKMILRKS